jgi:DNA-binding MarR family transcriptional regulator
MDRHLSNQFGRMSLTEAEAHVLMHLQETGQASLAELQDQLGMRASTLTGIADRLERRGYATRSINPDDRRSLLVVLTQSGREIAVAVVQTLMGIEAAVASLVSPEDVSGFLAVMSASCRVARKEVEHADAD